ncbi:hypothetical protein AQUCO_00700716v1 [Aquilegia coerulea]|uniref:CBS domain-containing protein n=1 Tax=Aquilegia coerulea TaxID=218851 RepID=A0A2G5ELC4_AQUCA|nr:hypothetical protein AQUCO_00700716v1 [Aquilegia coerulea]
MRVCDGAISNTHSIDLNIYLFMNSNHDSRINNPRTIIDDRRRKAVTKFRTTAKYKQVTFLSFTLHTDCCHLTRPTVSLIPTYLPPSYLPTYSFLPSFSNFAVRNKKKTRARSREEEDLIKKRTTRSMSSLIHTIHTQFHFASISTTSSSSTNLLVLLPSHPTFFVSSSIKSSIIKLNHSLSQRFDRCRSVSAVAANGGTLMSDSSPSKNGVFTVGDFMTKKELLHVVKPTTTIDEALEILVENRITGFPVIDDDWKLVGLVSDYDLLALDSVSGAGVADTSMFPEADSSWKTFNEIQKLLSKTNGKVIADVMTPAPLVVRETTNLEDAARLLLETKYRRLPVVDSVGKLVGIITRGNVVRAALHIKREIEKSA